MRDTLALLAFFCLCFAVASPGAIFRPGAWYASLRKPGWTPPNWLFGPAWTVLFCMIAVAGWLVWRAAGGIGAAIVPLAIYAVNLAINAAWSGLVFGLRRLDLGFADVTALWFSIVALIYAFYPVSATAAWLLVPYLCWVSFAAALNFAVWRLNPLTLSSSIRDVHSA